MFAVLALDREPMQWAQLPAALKTWSQGAGGVAAVALAICCLAYKLSPGRQHIWRGVFPFLRGDAWPLPRLLFTGLTVASAIGYALGGLVVVASSLDIPLGSWANTAVDLGLTLGGIAAFAAVLVPVLTELVRFRLQRIGALARLSFKEVVRKRWIWAFAAIALIPLFAAWFVRYKPEDQLRTYVPLIYLPLAVLFWLVACWLGSFGIPTEVKDQSIHTIVTKPVERFEIVLGRFLGYGLLLTVVLFALAGVSLLYVVRGIREEAKKESYMARVPIFADQLSFHGIPGAKDDRHGENVGRVWGYREYIGGPHPGAGPGPRQYAIWSFDALPSYSASFSNPVFFEFTFDIYRLTKGKEDRGVDANFTFADGSLSVDQVEKQLERLQQERARRQGEILRQADAKIKQGESTQKVLDWKNAEQQRMASELSAAYGLFEISMEVLDYHTQALGGDDPVERKRVGLEMTQLFQSIKKREKERPRPLQDGQAAPPALKVLVSLDRQAASSAQKLGVARRDLYVLADTGPFWLNFIKGVIGMWFTVMLILAIAVTASTYFSGIISLLVTVFLLLAGYFKGSVLEMLQGKGGGPFESAWRLFTKSPAAARLDESPTTNLLRGGDEVYRFFVRLISNLFPDINRYDLQPYVANGFDISWSQILFLDNLLPLAGYVVPCALLAFYLVKLREVANPT